MAVDRFDSKYLRPLMAGKDIVRVGSASAQHTTVSVTPTAVTNSIQSHTLPAPRQTASGEAFRVHANVAFAADGTAGLDAFEGLMICDTGDGRLKYCDGTTWETIARLE